MHKTKSTIQPTPRTPYEPEAQKRGKECEKQISSDIIYAPESGAFCHFDSPEPFSSAPEEGKSQSFVVTDSPIAASNEHVTKQECNAKWTLTVSFGDFCRERKLGTFSIHWTILAFCCVTMLGIFYVSMLPASLHSQLQSHMPNMSSYDTLFSLTFALQAVPNIVLPFIIGFVLDKMGARKCFLATTMLCFFGQIISSAGVQAQSWILLLVGYFIFGIGFESAFVSNNTLLSHRFASGRGVGVALGISSLFCRAGSLTSFVLGPPAANNIGVSFAAWIGTVFMAASVSASIGASHLDKMGENSGSQAGPRATDAADDASMAVSTTVDLRQVSPGNIHAQTTSERSQIHLADAAKFRCTFWLLCLSCALNHAVVSFNMTVASGLLLERDLFVSTPQDCILDHPNECSSGYMVPNEGNKARDAYGVECPAPRYAPAIPSSLNETGLESSWRTRSYVFNPLRPSDVRCDDPFWYEACTKNYCSAQSRATEKAGRLMTILYVTAIAGTVFVGYLTDKTGWRTQLLCLGPSLTAAAHSLLAFTSCSPLYALILLGLGFAIAAATVWPSVSYAVDRRAIGTGIGIMTSVQNVGLTVFPLVATSIYSRAGENYLPYVELFFICCAALALLDGIAIFHLERVSGNKMNQIDR